MVTDVVEVTRLVVTVNVALVLPAATVTLVGVPAVDELSVRASHYLWATPRNVTAPLQFPNYCRTSTMLRFHRWSVGAVPLMVTTVPAGCTVAFWRCTQNVSAEGDRYWCTMV